MAHCRVEHVHVLLRPVDAVNVEIEILRLIDRERLLAVGQRFRIGYVRVFRVIVDRDLADRSDLDRAAGFSDLAFVVAIANLSLPVDKRFLKGGQG
jgi:hypothetical protein